MTTDSSLLYGRGDGDSVLVVSSSTAILLGGASTQQCLDLWRRMSTNGGVDNFLEWVLDQGFRGFPHFMAAELLAPGGGQTRRFALRGKAVVRVTQSDGSVTTHSAEDRRTWLEVPLRDAVMLDVGDVTTPASWPLVAGVVAADRLVLTFSAATASDDAQIPHVMAAGQRPDSPDDPMQLSEAGIENVGAVPRLDNDSVSHVGARDPNWRPDLLDTPLVAPPPDISHGSKAARPPALVGLPEEPGSVSSESGLPTPPTGGVEPADDLPDSDDDTFDRIFGRTRVVTVEEAAVRLIESGDDPPAVTDSTGLDRAPVTNVPASDLLPPAAGTSPATGLTATAGDPGDHDGRTITAAELRRLQGGSGARAGQVPASVRASVCSRGHANPPQESQCRVCREPLEGTALRTIPRPVIGYLVFDGGMEVALTGLVLIGRRPRVNDQINGEAPNTLAVPSPEHGVSRTHLEVRVDGWTVQVTDLGTTNGTEVVLPGEAPRRLRKGEPCIIVPGTLVRLADEITGRFEVRE